MYRGNLNKQLDSNIITNEKENSEKSRKAKREERVKECSDHVICNHTTSDCRVMKGKRRDKKVETKSLHKNYAVNIKKDVPEILVIPVLIKNEKYNEVFNTGSSYSRISQSIAVKHKFANATILKKELI
ncbi:hypothetical protein DMUE_0385 [Dictyocoela muelleri]|nr:hypothetical protein DMUE_0385 [Dictyocoela muelleri]